MLILRGCLDGCVGGASVFHVRARGGTVWDRCRRRQHANGWYGLYDLKTYICTSGFKGGGVIALAEHCTWHRNLRLGTRAGHIVYATLARRLVLIRNRHVPDASLRKLPDLGRTERYVTKIRALRAESLEIPNIQKGSCVQIY